MCVIGEPGLKELRENAELEEHRQLFQFGFWLARCARPEEIRQE